MGDIIIDNRTNSCSHVRLQNVQKQRYKVLILKKTDNNAKINALYVAFLHSEDSYSAIVAQLPEKQEYLCYSDERVMKKFFMCMKI